MTGLDIFLVVVCCFAGLIFGATGIYIARGAWEIISEAVQDLSDWINELAQQALERRRRNRRGE